MPPLELNRTTENRQTQTFFGKLAGIVRADGLRLKWAAAIIVSGTLVIGCSSDKPTTGASQAAATGGAPGTSSVGGSSAINTQATGGTDTASSGGANATGGSGGENATGGSGGANNTATGGTGTAGAAAGGNSASTGGAGGAATVPTLYMVGDSTVAAFTDAYYYPRYGYGTQIGNYLNKNIVVSNLAASGRSTKSFVTENTNYAQLTAGLKAGDYVMIGFGHNDEKADSTLYTNPNTDVTDPTSFKYYLYTYFIQVALAKGATPILATPIVRRDAAGAYTGAKAHITTDVVSGGVTYPGGDYPKAVRELGAAYGVTVIDMTALTMALGKQIFAASGAAGTANLQAWVSNVITSVDDTHTNIYGGSYYAYLIANALTTSSSTLKDYVLPGITPPDLTTTLVSNPNWVPITYAPPVKGTVWTTTDPWIGSVFGDVGGASKITDGVSYGIAETSASPLTVTVRSGTATGAVGKIAAATEGIAFYFQQIPIGKDFTLSATATVTSINYNNSQVGFGIMVRDAAWVDRFDASLLSSYVASGTLKGNTPATAWSSFIRNTLDSPQLSGTIVSSAAAVPAAGSVIPLSIVKSGSTYTCTYGTEAPVSYTLSLDTIDPQFVYAGLFTARQCEIVFSNVSLTVTN